MEDLTGPATTIDIGERDWWRCIRCGVVLAGGAGSVHHRALGNRADRRPVVLILFCGSGTTGCHGWVHHNRTLARLAGWIVFRDADPALCPVYYNQPGRTGWQVLAGDLTVTPDPDPGPVPLMSLPDAA